VWPKRLFCAAVSNRSKLDLLGILSLGLPLEAAGKRNLGDDMLANQKSQGKRYVAGIYLILTGCHNSPGEFRRRPGEKIKFQ
jgi:hypothetical protein